MLSKKANIVSVIKMSDLYDVSLDYLLKEKEEKPMPSYMEYLEESTNTVKSKNKLSMVILIATYLGIWAFALIAFWLLGARSDAMGYSIMYLWLLLPVTTFVISLLIGKNNYFGRWKWITPVVMGMMYMLAEYGTFSTANMVAFAKFNMPDFSMILIGAIIAFIGLSIGWLLGQRKAKQK